MTPREWALQQLQELAAKRWAAEMCKTSIACLREKQPLPIVIANCMLDDQSNDVTPVLAILQAALNRECQLATLEPPPF